MESSGEAGVIVVTFGSMVTNLSSEYAEVIAAAFGQMPQKVRLSPTVDSARLTYVDMMLVFALIMLFCMQVIWRYSGPPPKTLSANTKLLKWIPQNDLLGTQTHTHTPLNVYLCEVFHTPFSLPYS